MSAYNPTYPTIYNTLQYDKSTYDGLDTNTISSAIVASSYLRDCIASDLITANLLTAPTASNDYLSLQKIAAGLRSKLDEGTMPDGIVKNNTYYYQLEIAKSDSDEIKTAEALNFNAGYYPYPFNVSVLLTKSPEDTTINYTNCIGSTITSAITAYFNKNSAYPTNTLSIYPDAGYDYFSGISLPIVSGNITANINGNTLSVAPSTGGYFIADNYLEVDISKMPTLTSKNTGLVAAGIYNITEAINLSSVDSSDTIVTKLALEDLTYSSKTWGDNTTNITIKLYDSNIKLLSDSTYYKISPSTNSVVVPTAIFTSPATIKEYSDGYYIDVAVEQKGWVNSSYISSKVNYIESLATTTPPKELELGVIDVSKVSDIISSINSL